MLTEDEAQLHIEREQRKNDLLLMRSLDSKLGVKRGEVTNVMLELNLRIVQYVYQFKAFSLQFLTLQTIQDFNRHLIVLQNKKLDTTKPVAILRDKQNTKVLIDQSINRQSFDDGGVIYFIQEKDVK